MDVLYDGKTRRYLLMALPEFIIRPAYRIAPAEMA